MTMTIDPWDEIGSVLSRAREAQSAGDRELAYTYFARASELSTNSQEAWRGRASTTTLPEDALVSCAYASALMPGDASLASELDRMVHSSAESAEAKNAPALVNIGMKLSEVGLVDEGHLLLDRAIELDETSVEGLIWAAATTDDLNEAAVALKRALSLDPKEPRARAGFSTVMIQLEAMNAATQGSTQTNVSKIGESASDSAPELIRAGEQALMAGNRTLAYQAFVRATELAPLEEAGWLGRARAGGDIDETLTCLEQALAINPDNMQAREARTFYRVRKLREGVRKRQEPEAESPRFIPTFAGGGGFSEEPTPEVRQRRILLLVIMIGILVFLILAAVVRLELIGR